MVTKTTTGRACTIFLAGGLLLPFAAVAQYKSIGPDGRITYSDSPPPANARVIDQKQRPAATAANPPLPFELQQAATRYPVTLYTGDRCPPCDQARTFLRSRGVPFTERTVTSDDDIALFKQQSPDGTAPVMTVGSRKLVGFTEAAWSGILDSAGYPLTAALPRDYQNPAPAPLSPNTKAAAQNVADGPAPRRPTQPAATSAAPPAAPPAATPGFRF